MKKFLFAGLLLGLSAGAIAETYEPIPYYGGNPFIFCKLGVPEDCWVPVDPTKGTYRVTDKDCFKSDSAKRYQRVCNAAFAPGTGGGQAVTPPDWVNGKPPTPPTNTHQPDPSLIPPKDTVGSAPSSGSATASDTPPFAAPAPQQPPASNN